MEDVVVVRIIYGLQLYSQHRLEQPLLQARRSRQQNEQAFDPEWGGSKPRKLVTIQDRTADVSVQFRGRFDVDHQQLLQVGIMSVVVHAPRAGFVELERVREASGSGVIGVSPLVPGAKGDYHWATGHPGQFGSIQIGVVPVSPDIELASKRYGDSNCVR